MGFLDNNGLSRLWQHINSLLGNYVPKARTINNKSLTDNITLSASDISAIPTSAKGAASGVASLGTDGKVPTSQLPALGEANQNAFSNIKVGSTTIAADSKTDTLTVAAGANITLTPDASGDTLTIAATDTTYSAATTSANGLMTSDMVTKLNGIATNANNYSHPNSGVTAGTYKSVTVNAQGHVTAGTNPTTLSGYGITDAVPSSRTVNGKALTSNITLAASDVGLGSVDNVRQYSASNPPPYPVTSVNGSTGAVTVNASSVGLGNVDNVKQYSASNPPPYPVTSVNGMTGAVTIDVGGTKPAFAHNILDNSDFRFGRFINQAGETTYTNAQADRWYPNGNKTSITINNSYLTMSNQDSSQHSIQQRMPKNAHSGKTLTAAIKLSNGTLVVGSATIPSTVNTSEKITLATGSNFTLQFQQASNMDIFMILLNSRTSINVSWVALYEGSFTAETLPEYQYKGYAAELSACMFYYQIFHYNFGQNNVNTNTEYPSRYPIQFRPMRTIPTATFYESWNDNVAKKEVSDITQNSLDVCFAAGTGSTFTQWEGYIELVAEL